MNKSFRNKLALLMAVMVAFCSFSFVGCVYVSNDEATADEAAVTTTESKNDSEVSDGDAAGVVTTPDKKDYVLAKVYKPFQAFKDGEEVNLDTVFGKGYAQYGDELVFNTDGTFTAYIGVNAGADSTTGTYELRLTNNDVPEIELCYNNDTKEIAAVTTINVDNNVVELRLEKNGYYILFKDVNN